MSYFRLHPWVFLVTGKKKSVIADTAQRKTLWISEDIADALRHAEKNEPVQESGADFFRYLETENMGAFYPEAVAIDKLRIFNVFNEKKFHKNTPSVEIAYFHLTNRCDLDCPDCGSLFCGSCVRKDTGDSDLPVEEWIRIIDDLQKRGLKSVILTGGEPLLYEGIDRIIDELKHRKIGITLQTHGYMPIPEAEYVSVVITLMECSDMSRIEPNIRILPSCTILDTTGMEHKGPENCTVRPVSSRITRGKLQPLSLSDYYIRKTYDSCLRNKVFISHSGNVYPCFQAPEGIGSVPAEGMAPLLKKLVEEYWKYSVDVWDSCADCEFRYNCRKCRFLSPACCDYDKENAVWN